MKRITIPVLLLFFAVQLSISQRVLAEKESGWHYPLYLPGDGYWQERLPVSVYNETDTPLEGRPVSVDVSALEGSQAKNVRVCNVAGVEMLFSLISPEGLAFTSGQIPSGSKLVFPAECDAMGKARYFIYFKNLSAGRVPDYFKSRIGLINGSVEGENGITPSGWEHDAGDNQHKSTWSKEQPHEGARCLKTVVADGAEATWVSTRQRDVYVEAGVEYELKAWVKAQGVKGYVAWYVHFGNAQKSMMSSAMLEGGEGAFAWKELSQKFTVPAGADRISLGTVLHGTGTAWFDSVSLHRISPGKEKIRAEVEKVEQMQLKRYGNGKGSSGQLVSDPKRIWHRAVVKAFNFSDTAKKNTVIDLRYIKTRARNRLDFDSLQVTQNGKKLTIEASDTVIFVEADIPLKSESLFLVDFAELKEKQDLIQAPVHVISKDDNLLNNAGFEQKKLSSSDWKKNGDKAAQFSSVEPGEKDLGKQCLKLEISTQPKGWPGWVQSVAVQPNQNYLVGGWIKTRDVKLEDARIHIHQHQKGGVLTKKKRIESTDPPSGNLNEWNFVSHLVRTEFDAVTLSIQLTSNHSGTYWYDEIMVIPIAARGELLGFRYPRTLNDGELLVWSVPSVEKIFPDSLDTQGSLASVSMARNEQESLQLAIASGQKYKNVRIEVDPPTGPGGAVLDDFEINVVAYVPVDYPTSYYVSNTPDYQRKIPEKKPKCDGWPGLWPDPLLPRQKFDLEANKTESVWITFKSSKTSSPGDYKGTVRFIGDKGPLGEIPIQVHVWDFTLPEENHLKAIYDVRNGPGSVWKEDSAELYEKTIRFMHDRRLCPDQIRPAPKIRYVDGKVEADFTDFDKAAEVYFNEMKFPHSYTPWSLYIFGWAHPPGDRLGIGKPYEGEAPFDGVDRNKLRPEYKKAYQACLKVYWDHMKSKGWADKIVLYISDEPHYYSHPYVIPQMRALCEMIHEVDPKIRIYSSTWGHVPEWDGSLDIWGLGNFGEVPVAQMKKLKAAGDSIWITVDGQMCIDTPYCATERLLPHHCFKYGMDAYEFWGITWLTYDPHQHGWHSFINQTTEPGEYYWTRYPSGDGYLIYPGHSVGHDGLVSSIRLEQAREGMEDYEYLYMLRNLVTAAKKKGKDVSTAEAALKRADDLVHIPNADGRHTSRNLSNANEIDLVRRDIAKAIELLK